MKPKICVFDFDGTLTTRDTLLLFIRYARGERAFWCGMLLFSPLLVLMKLHVLNNGKVKERVFRHFFRGMTEKEFHDWCEWFAEDFAHILRPEGMQTLRQALADGHQVFVVSASIDRWIAPFLVAPLLSPPRGEDSAWQADSGSAIASSPLGGDKRGAFPFWGYKAAIIGTEIEVQDGLLTGRFATPNCYGEEKVRRLRQLVPDLDERFVVVYGDSQGDKALFRIAAETHYKPFRR